MSGRSERRPAASAWRRVVAMTCCAYAASATSCLRPGEERAERDERVGRASIPSLRVEVAQGHAAVRELTEDRVHLWASAPTLSVGLEILDVPFEGVAGASDQGSLAPPRALEVFVENCMPNAGLEVTAGVARVDAAVRRLPTECGFLLAVESRRLELRLADPDADATGGFHFGVLSDIQEAIDRVGDVYRRINQETHLAFVLGAGDLTRRGTVEELERFQRELKALDLPYYTTLGNHELGESPPPYQDYFGRGNLSFSFRGVRFTLLDSASATLDPRVYDWLDGWLELGSSATHVVAMHIPPLDPIGVRNGSFASRNEATKLLGRLARGNVDATIYGHIHSYYAFQNAGIPAYISGGGGAIPERFDALGRHFLDVTVDSRGIAGVRVVRVD